MLIGFRALNDLKMKSQSNATIATAALSNGALQFVGAQMTHLLKGSIVALNEKVMLGKLMLWLHPKKKEKNKEKNAVLIQCNRQKDKLEMQP